MQTDSTLTYRVHFVIRYTPWTIQSMEFSRPEYWSGQPFPSPGNLPNPGIKPRSLALQADFLPAKPTREAQLNHRRTQFSLYYKYIYLCNSRIRTDICGSVCEYGYTNIYNVFRTGQIVLQIGFVQIFLTNNSHTWENCIFPLSQSQVQLWTSRCQ